MSAFQRIRKYSLLFTEKRIKCNSTIHLDLFAFIVTLWINNNFTLFIVHFRYFTYKDLKGILKSSLTEKFRNELKV